MSEAGTNDRRFDPADERRHPPGEGELWNESWYFDWAVPDGSLGGYVRVGLYPNLGVTWYWACVVGPGRPLVTVVDHTLPVPRGTGIELRGDGIWADHTCEVPGEHWTLGLEAFAIALDDPAEAYADAYGERLPLGLDLEWETDAAPYPQPEASRYEVPCRVHGEVLVGSERHEIDAWGERDHSWGVRDWWRVAWCWTAGRFGDGTAFHAFRPLIAGVDFHSGYWQPPGGRPEPVGGFGAEPVLGEHGLPTSTAMTFGSTAVTCTPTAFAPVLLRSSDGRVSRFPRALCRFDAGDGRSGFGWTEWNQPQG